MYTLDCQYIHSEKFKYFVTYIQNYTTNQCNTANILHKIYDKNSIIEYELIVYALDNMLRYMENKYIKHITQSSKNDSFLPFFHIIFFLQVSR